MYDVFNSAPASAFIRAIEGLVSFSQDVFKGSLQSYCELETNDGEFTLVAEDGSMVSAIRINGMLAPAGSREFEKVVEALTLTLQPFMKQTTHSMQIFFARDPSETGGALDSVMRGSRKTVQRLGLDFEDVLDARISRLSAHCASEDMYLALWTTPNALSKQDRKIVDKRLKEANSRLVDAGLATNDRTVQPLLPALPPVREKHEAFVSTIKANLRTQAGLLFEDLTAKEMAAVARKLLDPGFTPPGWEPTLQGDPIPRVLRRHQSGEVRELDLADAMPLPVSWQVFPRDAERIGPRYAQLGDRIYAPVFVEIPPKHIQPFSDLFERMADAGIPYRISFMIDGGGLTFRGIKGAASSLLGWAGSYNKLIHGANEALNTAHSMGNVLIRLKISLMTWVDCPADPEKRSEALELLRARASRLAYAVSAWGNIEVREVSGDPVAGVISSTPFLTRKSVANPAIAPLSDIVRMLPVMRPASPWRVGAMLYRTDDGKLMPFQPGSSLQNTWNYIFFARPGAGKSVALNMVLTSTCVEPGKNRLPRMAVMDIGDSSKGMIELIKDSLPPSQQHYAAHFRMRMTSEYAINPFDTWLGYRKPTPEQRQFLQGLLSLLATPVEADAPYKRMSSMAARVIDELYFAHSDDPKATRTRRYSDNACPPVQTLLEQYGFPIERQTTWWEIVDFLFAKGHVHEAGLAQRYAMPLMSDVPAIAIGNQGIVDAYGNVTLETGETLNKAFAQLVTDALQAYPVLTEPTRFDIGDSRITAINLEDVAGTGSRVAERQTAVMYMLARFALTKDYRMSEESVKEAPDAYKAMHLQRAKDIREDMKFICYDEFHRTSKVPAIQADVLNDMKEGRKMKIGVILSSQNVDDFPEALRAETTGAFMLDGSMGADKLQQMFKFNDTCRALLEKHCNGPTAKGAPFLVQLSTKAGQYTQLLYSSIGALEAWMLSTTAEDVRVRAEVNAVIGGLRGRRALAAAFPDGTAVKEIERIRNRSEAAAKRVDPIRVCVDRALEADARLRAGKG
jgi:intracellular multiplication protein IcmB